MIIIRNVKKMFIKKDVDILYFKITCIKFDNVDPIRGDMGKLRNFFID